MYIFVWLPMFVLRFSKRGSVKVTVRDASPADASPAVLRFS